MSRQSGCRSRGARVRTAAVSHSYITRNTERKIKIEDKSTENVEDVNLKV